MKQLWDLNGPQPIARSVAGDSDAYESGGDYAWLSGVKRLPLQQVNEARP
jgi:hypothetical protein